MTEQEMQDVTSDDRLWALLAYVLTPLVPIILMLWEEKKNRAFIRAHNGQALVLGVIELILYVVLGWAFIGFCAGALLWLAGLYWGWQAYQGNYVEIPVVTNFVRNQGWA